MIKLHISWLSFELERLGATSRQIDQVAHNPLHRIMGHIAHFYFLVYLWTSPSRIPFVAALGNTSNGRVDAGEVVLGHPEHRTMSDTKPRKALHVRQSSLTNTRQGPLVISMISLSCPIKPGFPAQDDREWPQCGKWLEEPINSCQLPEQPFKNPAADW